MPAQENMHYSELYGKTLTWLTTQAASVVCTSFQTVSESTPIPPQGNRQKCGAKISDNIQQHRVCSPMDMVCTWRRRKLWNDRSQRCRNKSKRRMSTRRKEYAEEEDKQQKEKCKKEEDQTGRRMKKRKRMRHDLQAAETCQI